MKLTRKNQAICENIAIIDGFSNSGKSLIAPIFGYLDNVEKWQIDYRFEYIAMLHYLDKISDDAADVLLNIGADNLLYDLSISRNVNFRKTDASSPYRDGLEEQYLARLERQEGDIRVVDIHNDNPVLPLHVHYLFGFTDSLLHFFGSKIKLYLICLRHPLELIVCWKKGDWVNKIGHVDREFHLCIEYKGNQYPWYTKDYLDDYHVGSELEKTILTVYYYYKKVFEMYARVDRSTREKFLFIPIEQFILNPDKFIDEICIKLSTDRSAQFNRIINILKLPREQGSLSNVTTSSFIKEYGPELNKDYHRKIEELVCMYNEFLTRIQ
ncbi:hypothetical protein [Desulforhopalus sp. 52FAK]